MRGYRVARLAAVGGIMITGMFMSAAAAHATDEPSGKTVVAPTATAASPTAQELAAKPRTPAPNLIGYTVSLSASSTYPWVTQYSTLTARANQDVGPTPYWISIVDTSTGNYVAICGSGTVCTASVTRASVSGNYYRAYVASYPTNGTVPPANTQASSPAVYVYWHFTTVSLAASPTTLIPGSSSTLTATTAHDVGPSPFWTAIFDATTGTRVTVCGSGTTCSTTVSQPIETTHRYIAYVSNYSSVLPPPGIRTASNSSFVTWSYSGYRLSLNLSRNGSNATLTAVSNRDVGPTPYYIEIFNLRNSTRVAVCGTGTTCTVTVRLLAGSTDFVAFTSGYSTLLPPAQTQASSRVVRTTY